MKTKQNKSVKKYLEYPDPVIYSIDEDESIAYTNPVESMSTEDLIKQEARKEVLMFLDGFLKYMLKTRSPRTYITSWCYAVGIDLNKHIGTNKIKEIADKLNISPSSLRDCIGLIRTKHSLEMFGKRKRTS